MTGSVLAATKPQLQHEPCLAHYTDGGKMKIGSTEILAYLAHNTGSYILDELGAPHRDDLKNRTVTLKASDDRDIEILGEGGPKIPADFIRAGLVYEAVPLDDKFRRIYRLTPDGLKRGKA